VSWRACRLINEAAVGMALGREQQPRGNKPEAGLYRVHAPTLTVCVCVVGNCY
jgi:hypothetical protein